MLTSSITTTFAVILVVGAVVGLGWVGLARHRRELHRPKSIVPILVIIGQLFTVAAIGSQMSSRLSALDLALLVSAGAMVVGAMAIVLTSPALDAASDGNGQV